MTFDLSDLVRETVAMFAAAARHAGAQIDIDAPASLLGTWDRLAVEQIIDNLVSNAIKCADRPVENCAEDRGDNVYIRIRDHGPGISSDARTRIFGRFERADG